MGVFCKGLRHKNGFQDFVSDIRIENGVQSTHSEMDSPVRGEIFLENKMPPSPRVPPGTEYFPLCRAEYAVPIGTRRDIMNRSFLEICRR